MLVPALGMVLVPKAVRDYVAGLPHPTGLMGCRAAGEMSHPCCEYDIAVFGQGENRLEKVDGHIIELVHISRPKDHLVALRDMSIIKDSKAFSISSTLKGIADEKDEKFKKALFASGRKALVSSLFCQQKFKLIAKKKDDEQQQVAGAMWLKMASYHLVAGTLAIFGARPMPLHELAQARQADLPADAADGVQAALECIGIERATRPAIARSTEAMMELKSKDYDKELVRVKVEHLLEKSMLADCYYYAGRVAAENLATRNDAFFRRYAKLVQLAMDLSSDEQRLEKLRKSLSLAAKSGLKTTVDDTTTFS
ncbi:hypothetical protein NTE_00967 [Candidatus Nitrososphaera evergladensis SR1]|uniref:Nucleotidyltransferase n=1 Tax=Candidatus Nitrososphaera evergladensis SR1 TaxID=1459636 RepID=A0A075MQ82_9ARCH|nr:hypothetical protein [Candidatus Nitrososphaera evergladensis]AIF83042.1 hypothetical protein NTE_00967 [Candidatus Nitrososphaera evergladensis SR1]